MGHQAVIIGGGHNGLVCACYLAKAGLEVTILERRAIFGGAAVTEEFHPGFRNSVASYTVSLLHPRIIDDLHLHQHGLEIIERQVSNFLPLRDDNSLVSYPDSARMQREVARFSEDDAAHLPDFYNRLDSVVDLIRDLMLEIPPLAHQGGLADLWQMFRLSRRFAGMSLEDKRLLLTLFSASAGEMLDDNFSSDPLKALIGFDAIVGNYASPYQNGSAYVLLHHVIGEVNGKKGQWGHARGGMGSISNAMAEEAFSLGVKLETDTTVERVLVENGIARGVVTSTGEKIAADLVIANVNPRLLYLSMLDETDLSTATIQHFQTYKCQSGSFRMNVALSELPNFTADTPGKVLTGGIIMAPSLTYMDRAFTDARQRGFSKEPIVEMMIPSL
ncbi:MAG: NAD(P)/FAD-dependent oxidoreductase, partial [Gammaproteobacteria bacterium]|nr:NAD(P)/FAD-dependent oxidoreductase [Gammaproteobacteria bacterium]